MLYQVNELLKMMHAAGIDPSVRYFDEGMQLKTSWFAAIQHDGDELLVLTTDGVTFGGLTAEEVMRSISVPEKVQEEIDYKVSHIMDMMIDSDQIMSAADYAFVVSNKGVLIETYDYIRWEYSWEDDMLI